MPSATQSQPTVKQPNPTESETIDSASPNIQTRSSPNGVGRFPIKTSELIKPREKPVRAEKMPASDNGRINAKRDSEGQIA